MKTHISRRRIRSLSGLSGILGLLPMRAAAAVFDGPGVAGGLNAAASISGLSHRPIRELAVRIIINVLNFLTLVAVIVIVAAGVWLVLGFGEETSREKAQRMITYTVVGLVIVFLARLMVSFILSILKTAA